MTLSFIHVGLLAACGLLVLARRKTLALQIQNDSLIAESRELKKRVKQASSEIQKLEDQSVEATLAIAHQATLRINAEGRLQARLQTEDSQWLKTRRALERAFAPTEIQSFDANLT